jgi:hypothetical protein
LALLAAHDHGTDVAARMAQVYEGSRDVGQKTWIAQMFWGLGLESKEAKQALMKDIHTPEQQLRLQVQWALGRVSGDDEVVRVLLDNMMNDQNPLFRDKAACALAEDQVHLKPKQKAKLYEGVIGALASQNPQVRQIAIQVLKIQLGQDKGYNPGAPEPERQAKIQEWRKWLTEFQAQL